MAVLKYFEGFKSKFNFKKIFLLWCRQSSKVDVPGQHQQEMELLRDAETVRDTEQTLVNEIKS